MSTKPNHTDPTYLRNIHDGLLSGAVHKDNASAVPLGLVGMYEEALPPATNVNERKKFLEFFSIWALLKKEVSAEFVLSMLEGWTEGQIIEYIAQYSKWFNSPVSGKYVLYHERLRTFILQKVSAHQFEKCNEQIIHQCQLALKVKAVDEWELYALEYLSTHLLIQAIRLSDDKALKLLVYKPSHWERQVEISKGFEWSRRMLSDMMLWTSHLDDENFIECILNKLDLFYLEQNDAPRIVELISQNDIESALNRISAFGGIDKNGIQRKFIVYLLCLLELTLLDSKDKPFRVKAIEALITHLDENLNVDYSILSWSEFFPSYLMFQLSCNWAYLGIDYNRVFSRTKEWESSWIPEKGPYTELEFKVLTDCVFGINDLNSRSTAIRRLAIELFTSEKLDESIATWEKAADILRVTSDVNKMCIGLLEISKELVQYGFRQKALLIRQEVISRSELVMETSKKISILFDVSLEMFKAGYSNEAEKILTDSLKIMGTGRFIRDSKVNILVNISSELAKLGVVRLASSILYDAYEHTKSFREGKLRATALKRVSLEFVKQGKFEEAVNCARFIGDDKTKCLALQNVSSELFNLGLADDSQVFINEALELARLLIDDEDASISLKSISSELFEQGKVTDSFLLINEALSLARNMCVANKRAKVLIQISSELNRRNQTEEALNILKEAWSNTINITVESDRDKVLGALANEFAIQCYDENAMACARLVHDESYRIDVIKDISKEILKTKGEKEAKLVLFEALESAKNVTNEYYRCQSLHSLAFDLMKLGGVIEASSILQEALVMARGVSDDYWKSNVLKEISSAFLKLGHINDADSISQGIIDEQIKTEVLLSITAGLVKEGKIELAYKHARSILNDSERSKMLLDISKELVQCGFRDKATIVWQEALNSAYLITSNQKKCQVLSKFSLEMYRGGYSEEADIILKDALSLDLPSRLAQDIKLDVLCNISSELATFGNLQKASSLLREAIVYANGNSDERVKIAGQNRISLEFAKLGKLDDALNSARQIIDEKIRCAALVKISSEIHNQGLFDASDIVMKEALEIAKMLQDDEAKCNSLKSISVELFELGKLESALLIMNEALETTRGIGDVRQNCRLLKDISIGLSRIDQKNDALLVLQEAFFLTDNIQLEYEKDKILRSISDEFTKQGFTQNAMQCARSINNELDRSIAMRVVFNKQFSEGQIEDASNVAEEAINSICLIRDENIRESELEKISMEVVKIGKSELAEKTVLRIKRNISRTRVWQDWASYMLESYGWESAIQQADLFYSREARFYYLQSLADVVSVVQLPDLFMKQAYPLLADDYYGLEILLQKHAVRLVSFRDISDAAINRLNRTLNIQWAIDIAAQFPNEEGML